MILGDGDVLCNSAAADAYVRRRKFYADNKF